MNKLFVIMGVSGCGKSVISAALAKRKGWPVLEADDYHSSDNIAKMSKGIPLTDQDREPWVDIICAAVKQTMSQSPVILACSALTPMVQSRLREGVKHPIIWIWLDGCADLINQRLVARQGHFMPESLLASQLHALTIPTGVIQIDIDQSVERILAAIEAAIELK